MSVASCGLRPPPPNPVAPTTSCPFTEPATVSLIDALIDAANTVNSVTTPTPIISAVAVPAVRRGLRIALRRASEPVIPRRRGRGAPITRLAGRATTGPNTDDADDRGERAERAQPDRRLGEHGEEHERDAAGEQHRARDRAQTRTRCVRSTLVSRSTASGATRDAFHAGAAPASSVIVTPASNEITAVDGSNAMPPDGSAAPKLANSAFKQLREDDAAEQPGDRGDQAQASAPRRVTHVRICRRDAPIVRSSADSRVRWATRIENVLWMQNAATSIAMPGEDDEERLERVEEVVAELVRGPAWCAGVPVIASTPRGSTGSDAREQLLLRDAVVGAHDDARHLTRAGDVLLGRVEREERVRDGAEAVLAPERRDPDDRHLVRLGRRHQGRVADVQVAVLGRAAVDHDLVRRARRAPFRDAERVELRIVDPAARERRRTVAAERVAVLAADLAVALDRRRHRGDAVDRGDGVGDRRVDDAALRRRSRW